MALADLKEPANRPCGDSDDLVISESVNPQCLHHDRSYVATASKNGTLQQEGRSPTSYF